MRMERNVIESLNKTLTGMLVIHDETLIRYIIQGVRQYKHPQTGDWLIGVTYKDEGSDMEYFRDLNSFLARFSESYGE